MIQKTTDATLTSDVSTEGVVLVKLTASWCGPCRMYNPVLAQFNDDTGVPVYELDIDNNPQTPIDFGVMSVPTTLVYEDGVFVKQFTGAKNFVALKKELASVLDA